MEFDADNHILTRHDVEGAEPQKYDAFILFADADIVFVKQLIDKLENQYKLKLCLKERDLVAGVFEHDSVIRLISERCNRLVAIISPAFLKSASNRFFCSFAQFIGIEQRRRKIVPCLYTQCEVPWELKCYFILDCRRIIFGNLWEKLRDSIQTRDSVPGQMQNIHRSASQSTSNQSISSTPHTNDIKSSLQCVNDTLKTEKTEENEYQNIVKLISEDNNSVVPDQTPTINSTPSYTNKNKKCKSMIKQLKKIFQIPKTPKKVIGNRTIQWRVAAAK